MTWSKCSVNLPLPQVTCCTQTTIIDQVYYHKVTLFNTDTLSICFIDHTLARPGITNAVAMVHGKQASKICVLKYRTKLYIYSWIKIQLPLLRRNAWRHSEIQKAMSLDFVDIWTYFVLYTFHTKLFNYDVIGIGRGRLEIMSKTPSWFFRWGRPESAARVCTFC